MKKFLLYFILGFCFLNNNMSFAVVTEQDIDNHIASFFSDKDKLIRTVKNVGMAAKYTAGAISILYALNGVKKTIDTAKSVLAVDRELKFTDFLMLPFRLLAFPFKVIDIGRSFVIAGSFAAASYGLYRVGA